MILGKFCFTSSEVVTFAAHHESKIDTFKCHNLETNDNSLVVTYKNKEVGGGATVSAAVFIIAVFSLLFPVHTQYTDMTSL